jgi:hypothetical protein
VTSNEYPEPGEPGPDPYDPESHRDDSENIPADKVFTCQARKPGKDEWFRVCPDQGYMLPSACTYERSADAGRETYLVMPAYRQAFGSLAKSSRVFTCVNRYGDYFLWAAKLPVSGGGANSYYDSALAAAAEAMHLWVRMESNQRTRVYDRYVAHGDLGEPKWPDQPFRDLLALAFPGDRLVNSYDHPVLRELRGEL